MERICGPLFIYAILMVASLQAWASPATLTYQGRILKSDGTALTYNSVSFIFKIYNPSGSCLIYQEQYPGYDMSTSNGIFDVPIGSGTVTYPTDGSVSLADAFNNSATFTCSGGAAYTPTSTHGRLLRVMFYDGSGWQTITPDNVIRSVPYAENATSAEKLGVYASDDFLLKAGIPTCASGSYLTYNGTTLACASVSGASGGTVTSITAGAGLVGGTITASGTIALDSSGVAAGTYGSATAVPVFAVDSYGRVTSVTNTTITGVVPGGTASGDLSGTYPSPTVSGLKGTSLSISSLSSGQLLKYNGTNWINSTLVASDISDLSSTYLTQSSFNTYVASAACTAAQTMYWSSLSGSFACATISGVAVSGDITGTTSATTVAKLAGTALSISSLTSGQYLQYNGTNWVNSTISLSDSAITYGSQSANTFLAAPNGSAGTPSFRAMVAADLPTVPYTRGGTGLTATPTNGQVLIGNGSGYTLGTLTAGSNITVTNSAGGITIASTNSGGTVTSVTGSAPITVTSTTTTPVVSIAQATASADGYLSSADWTTFNSKLGSLTGGTLASGTMLVGNTSNVATAVTMSGDATLSTTGALTLASSGVTAGTYPKVTVNAKGLVTAGSSLSLSDLPTIATGTVLANVSGSTAVPSATSLSTLLDSVTNTQGSILYRNSSGWTYLAPGTSGQYLQTQGASANPQWATTTSGTVTSVGLSLPSIFSVTNSPVTSSGTLTATLASQTANIVLAAPNGSAGTPSFRTLVVADLPTVTVPYGGTGLTSGTSGGIPYYSGSTTMASSAALTQYGVVYGGGAGAAPATTAVGTSGYPLVSNGGSSAPSFQQISLSSAITGTLPIANGGTGATTAATARSSLGVAASGANTDITSITNSTGSITLAPTGALALTPTTYVTSTVPFAGPLGSAAAPSFTNTTAAATGMYFPSSTSLGFSTAGSNAMTIDSSGNVGIAKTSPGAKLDINTTGATLGIRTSSLGNSGPNLFYNGYSGALSSPVLTVGTYMSSGTFSIFNLETGMSSSSPGTGTSRFTVTASGNVGIGNSSPTNILDVAQSTDGNAMFSLANTNTGTSAMSISNFANGTGAVGIGIPGTGFTDNGDYQANWGLVRASAAANGLILASGSSSGPIAIRTAGSEAMRITSAGNVGISTTSPSYPLHVASTSAGLAAKFENSPALTADASGNYHGSWSTVTPSSSYNFTGSLYGAVNRIQTGASQTGTVNTAFGAISDIYHTSASTISAAYGNTGQVMNTSSGTITQARAGYFLVSNSSTGTITTAYGNYISPPTNSGSGSIGTFYGLYIGSPTAATTNYAIYSAGGKSYFGGNVGLGTTSPSYTLHVVGTAGLSTGTAWTNASDARLKDIHGDYEYGLNEVLKLHTVRYSYKKDNPLKLPSDFQKTGFIAQEVQKVIPDAVTKRKDGYLELNVDPIHWAVVNAVKELYKKWFDDSQKIHSELTEQKREIASLKEQNANLKKKVDELSEVKSALCKRDKNLEFCR